MQQNQSTGLQEREFVLTRIFEAPRELVWKAWTEPERVIRWWGPKGFTSPVCKIDLRVGGQYLNAMRSPDGQDFWSKGIYRDVIAPERLVLTDSFSDEKGNTVPASYYGMSSGWPLEMLITITFEELDSKTRLTLRYGDITGISDADRENMRQGWSQSFDKLAEYLEKAQTKFIIEPGRQEFFITREFDAPRELVFRAFVEPELYVQWLGPHRLAMTLLKFEPVSGGSWRYIHKDEAGNEYGFHGVFHEVLRPSRLIDTFEFEGLPETGHVQLETVRFEDLSGGRTRLKIQSVFQSVADRDGMVQSGMQGGVIDSHDRLDELLRKMMAADKEKPKSQRDWPAV